MKLQYLCSLAIVIGMSSIALGQAPTADEQPKEIVVPFELLPSRHFIVQVKINDEGPYRLILDTGAPITLINTRIAKDSGLIKKNASSGFSLFGGLNQTLVPKLYVGDALAEKTSAVVMDHPTVKAISDAFKKTSGPIDGIVGFPFFAKFAMTVDYQKKELRFTPTQYQPGDYLKDLTASLMKMDQKNAPKPLIPQALWGFSVNKPKSDDADGVVVTEVFTDSPAEKAGLKLNDRILTIDGRWTDTIGDTFLVATLVAADETVEMEVQRGDKQMTLKVTPKTGK